MNGEKYQHQMTKREGYQISIPKKKKKKYSVIRIPINEKSNKIKQKDNLATSNSKQTLLDSLHSCNKHGSNITRKKSNLNRHTQK